MKRVKDREILSNLATIACWIFFASFGFIGLSILVATNYFASETSNQTLTAAKSLVELLAGIATMVAAFAAVGGLYTWKKSLVGSTLYALQNNLRSAAYEYQMAVMELLDTP